MNKRLCRKLHKIATSGLPYAEFRRHIPRWRERMATARWRKLFPPGLLGRYWMPITRIIEENSLKNMVEIDDTHFLDITLGEEKG